MCDIKIFGSQPLCFECWSKLDLEFAEWEPEREAPCLTRPGGVVEVEEE